MNRCPIDKPQDDCPCEDYSKEGLCDWPYKNLTDGQIRSFWELYRSQILRAKELLGEYYDN